MRASPRMATGTGPFAGALLWPDRRASSPSRGCYFANANYRRRIDGPHPPPDKGQTAQPFLAGCTMKLPGAETPRTTEGQSRTTTGQPHSPPQTQGERGRRTEAASETIKRQGTPDQGRSKVPRSPRTPDQDQPGIPGIAWNRRQKPEGSGRDQNPHRKDNETRARRQPHHSLTTMDRLQNTRSGPAEDRMRASHPRTDNDHDSSKITKRSVRMTGHP